MFNLPIFMIKLQEDIIIDYEILVCCCQRIQFEISNLYLETTLLRSYNNPNAQKRSIFSSNIYGGQIEDDHIPFLNYSKL